MSSVLKKADKLNLSLSLLGANELTDFLTHTNNTEMTFQEFHNLEQIFG